MRLYPVIGPGFEQNPLNFCDYCDWFWDPSIIQDFSLNKGDQLQTQLIVQNENSGSNGIHDDSELLFGDDLHMDRSTKSSIIIRN